MKNFQHGLRGESLEPRRVLTAPAILAASLTPSSPGLGDRIAWTVDANDVDGDLQRVDLYLDNGDGAFGDEDQRVSSDADSAGGWSGGVLTNGPYSILPLGDSITQPEAIQQSYRYPLWQRLLEAGREFDFVGSETQNHDGTTDWHDYLGQSFDQDHEGHYGWRTDEILASLPTWLNNYTPDIALIHLGTNDLFQGQTAESTLDELAEIIQTLRQDNPNVAVLVASLIPSSFPSNSLIDGFNELLPARVSDWTSVHSPVLLVDQNSEIDAATHLYDGVHPNGAGESIMASVWANAIHDVYPITDPTATLTPGNYKFFAVATDADDSASPPFPITFTISDPDAEPEPEPNLLHAVEQSTVIGSVTGELLSTRSRDDQYQVLEEREQRGTPRLTHQWKFSVPDGVQATVEFEGYRTPANERYYVNYSSDGRSWRNIMSVDESSDTGLLQTATLPTGTSGDVWIRVKDGGSDGETEVNQVWVDYLAIRYQGEPEPSLPQVSVSTLCQPTEAGQLGQLVVTRTGATDASLSVPFAVSGDAIAGVDYIALPTSVVIPAGSDHAIVEIVPIEDDEEEGNESVIVTLSPDPSYELSAANQAIASIADNDGSDGEQLYFPLRERTIGGTAGDFANVLESDNQYEVLAESSGPNDSLTHLWEFEIPVGAPATVVVEASTIATSEVFYMSYSADGRNYQNMLVVSSDADRVFEYPLPEGIAETVFVKARDSNGNQGESDTLLIDQLFIRVQGDTGPTLPTVSISPSSAIVAEDAADPLDIQLSRTGDLTETLTVTLNYGGSATPAVDFEALPTQVTFNPGESTSTIGLQPIDDADPELNEVVQISIAQDEEYRTSGTSASVIITLQDDDGLQTEFFAGAESTRLGERTTRFVETLASDDNHQQLTESSNGRLLHLWQIEVSRLATLTLQLEAYTNSSDEVFWVNYSTDNRNFRNLLTIDGSSERVLSRRLPEEVQGTVYLKIVDSIRNSDVFADSVFIDELKLAVVG